MGTRLNTDGAKIRALRVQRGWTQEQLAEIAGVSSRTVQRAETANGAAFETLRAIAVAFEIDFDQLLLSDRHEDLESAAEPVIEPSAIPAHASAPGTDELVRNLPSRSWHSWPALGIAAVAMAAGLFAGGWFSYRILKSFGSQGAALQMKTAIQPRLETVSEGGRPDAGRREIPAVLPLPPAMISSSAVAPQSNKPAGPSVGLETRMRPFEITHDSDHTQRTSIPFPTHVTPLDLPAKSPGLITSMSHNAPPPDWGMLAGLQNDSMDSSQGAGPVRQALGEAGRKTGVFISKMGSSVKRAF